MVTVAKEMRSHCAKFSDSVLNAITPWLHGEAARKNRPISVLDPFAGVGRIHELASEQITTTGLELEPEWATAHPNTQIGDALNPPFTPGAFDVLATSPTYGSRMADTYDGRDGSVRHTYRISLGRMPTEGNSAIMQWGNTAYRRFHRAAWVALIPLVADDGLFILNISNHLRTIRKDDGQLEMHVAEWHIAELLHLGLRLASVEPVITPRMRHGANWEARPGAELLAVFRVPGATERTQASDDLAPDLGTPISRNGNAQTLF